MSDAIEVKVPDIGDFTDVPVIEVLVKPGDTVQAEDALITLESDKATMDVPAPFGGVVKEVKVKAGDKVAEGSVILLAEKTSAATAYPSDSAPAALPQTNAASAALGSSAEAPPPKAAPDKASRPATPEMPAPPASQPFPAGEQAAARSAASPTPQPSSDVLADRTREEGPAAPAASSHASPSVRRFARELGVDVGTVKGSGPKGRIVREDVQAYVKRALATPRATAAAPVSGLDLLPWPKIDFSKFGEVEAKPLSRIKKISGANLHRNWLMIPHVTNHDDADITELEAFRVQLNKENEKPRDNEKSPIKITLLAFLIKAVVACLKKFPEFNASLEGDNLILKKYYHIGFAADTPNGLIVPVIKDADKKGIAAIAREMSDLAGKAREGKLPPADMQGGGFSISSLGGIGGTYFTPIINAPEVAILGVCKAAMRPVWDGKAFAPRLILPLSLAWDHRVLDGAGAARFNAYLASLLADMRRTML